MFPETRSRGDGRTCFHDDRESKETDRCGDQEIATLDPFVVYALPRHFIHLVPIGREPPMLVRSVAEPPTTAL